MMYKSLITRCLLLVCFSLFTAGIVSADEVSDKGKVLFKANCAQCHNKNMKDDLTGPALGGVMERWETEELLYAWIRNSQEVVNSGDAYANQIFNKWNKVAMTSFPALTDEEINSILTYVNCMYDGSCVPQAAGGPLVTGAHGGSSQGTDNTFLFITLFLILGILAIVLARIISNLNHMAEVKAGNKPAPRRTLVEILTSKSVIGFVLFALVVLAGYTTVNNAIDLGRQQGYQPDQPIKFSHEMHAGLQKIDCQYCHDGARRSKHSVIPATNTCMNCHKAVVKGTQYGTGEISKIYASIGWNPNTMLTWKTMRQ